jgi:hypothetical protein
MKDSIVPLKPSKEIDHILYFVVLFIITFFLLTTIIGCSSTSAETENGVSTSETSPTQSKNTDDSSSKFSLAGIQFGMTKEEAISAINKINPNYEFYNFNEFKVDLSYNAKLYTIKAQNPENQGFLAYLECKQECAMNSEIIVVFYYEDVGVWAIVRGHDYNKNDGPTKDNFISYLTNKFNIPYSLNRDKDDYYLTNKYKIPDSLNLDIFDSRRYRYTLYFDLSNNLASKTICPSLGHAIVEFKSEFGYYGFNSLPVAASPNCGTYVYVWFEIDKQYKKIVQHYVIESVSVKHADQVLTPYKKEAERLFLKRESKQPDF